MKKSLFVLLAVVAAFSLASCHKETSTERFCNKIYDCGLEYCAVKFPNGAIVCNKAHDKIRDKCLTLAEKIEKARNYTSCKSCYEAQEVFGFCQVDNLKCTDSALTYEYNLDACSDEQVSARESCRNLGCPIDLESIFSTDFGDDDDDD